MAPSPEEEVHISFTVAGRTYTVRPAEVSASLSAEFRLQAGMSFRKVIELLQSDVDLDLLRLLMFLSERQHGKQVKLADMPDFGYDVDVVFEEQAAVEDPDSPEV